MKTLFQLHRDKWIGGCGSDCCELARSVCFFRGKIPSDICFVGEGPGETEDDSGFPFVGPAGSLLDVIVQEGLQTAGWPDLRTSFTNIVGCMPKGEDRKKSGAPSEEQVESCKPRLEEFLTIAKPRLIVAVGTQARDHLEQGYRWSTDLPESVEHQTWIYHPSFMLKQDYGRKHQLKNKAIIAVRDAIKRVWPDEPTE